MMKCLNFEDQSSAKAAGAVTNVSIQEAKAPEKSHIINNVETTDVKKVVGNDQVKISAGQEEQAQATVAACAADNSSAVDGGSENASVTRKRLAPNYSKEEQEVLKQQTDVVEAEIQRVIQDSRYAATPLDDSDCILNLRKAIGNGIGIMTPKINRIHGKDQLTTGESVEKCGAQAVLLVITKSMADAAGIDVTRFRSDKSAEPIGDDSLVIIDGNGRMDHLLGLSIDQWPTVYAAFPKKDALGLYNIAKVFEEVNTHVKVWTTQDHMQKRILEDGKTVHPGWIMVNDLLQKGYLYQAACIAATLGYDRIKKNEIVNGISENTVFKHHEHARRVHEALVAKFGEGDDKVLKMKAAPMFISSLWSERRDKGGVDKATDQMVDFINQLPDDVVKQIKEAKTKKSKGVKLQHRDDQRTGLIRKEYDKYFKKQ